MLHDAQKQHLANIRRSRRNQGAMPRHPARCHSTTGRVFQPWPREIERKALKRRNHSGIMNRAKCAKRSRLHPGGYKALMEFLKADSGKVDIENDTINSQTPVAASVDPAEQVHQPQTIDLTINSSFQPDVTVLTEGSMNQSLIEEVPSQASFSRHLEERPQTSKFYH